MTDVAAGFTLLLLFLVLMTFCAEFLHAWLESGRYNWRERGPSVIGPGEHPAVRVSEDELRAKFDSEAG